MSKLIGIFGGTFDPVHNGHIEIVVNLLRDIPFDEIRVVPNGTPPHRQSIGSVDDRLKMVSLAFERIKKITVDDREIRREGFSYAIDSAKEVLREFKNDQIIWIMGSDAFLEIKLWHKWEEFLDLVNILVLTRPDSKIDKNSNTWNLISDRKISDIKLLKGSGKIMILNIDPINISSTQVRSNIFNGKSVDNLIIEEVVDYIDEGKLYT